MAKHDKLTLNIAKAVRTSDYYVLKYSSTERGKIVDVTVKDTDNNPYDLTGLKLEFVEELYNNNIVVDVDNFNTNADDLKNGKFSYQFRDEVYQYDGWAHFKFSKNDVLIDTTAGFAIKIVFDIDDELDEKSYVVYFENIKKEHQTALNSLRELISSAQSLNDSNHSEISVIKGNITDLGNRLNNQVNSLGKRITDVNDALSGRIDTLNSEKNTLSGRVDTLNDEKNALSGRVDTLTTQNGTLNTQLNNAENEITELKSKVSTLESAGYVKGKFDGFSSADEARQWSASNHGIAIFNDEN
uniref:BppU family phage baseplate upper protein n=1 Tax=Lactobacillus acidophilus TaxID=1579 RepID=UPI003F542750